MKETGACALWAIAGHTKPIQKDIAKMMGVTTIIDLLLLKSEPLEYVGKSPCYPGFVLEKCNPRARNSNIFDLKFRLYGYDSFV